jgi:hypothetical protein
MKDNLYESQFPQQAQSLRNSMLQSKEVNGASVLNNGFSASFPGGDGVIYAIQQNGDLLWYRHDGWATGAVTWTSGGGTKVGNGWAATHVFPGGNGVIYAVQPSGEQYALGNHQNAFPIGFKDVFSRWDNPVKADTIANGVFGCLHKLCEVSMTKFGKPFNACSHNVT